MSQTTKSGVPEVSIGRRAAFIFASLFIGVSTLLGCVYLLAPLCILAYFDPKRFRRWSDHIMGCWFVLPTSLLEWVSGVEFEVRGDAIDPNERALIIINHRTRLDWLFLWQALYRMDPRLLTSEKITLKSALRHLPGLGWGMALDAFIFVDRRFDKDAKILNKTIDYFASNGQPYQILWFAEGTDLTADTKQRSDAFARANGLPLYDHVLHPRTTGFTHLVEKMKEVNYLDAIYDVTVGYSQSVVKREEDFFLRGQAPEKAHFHIQKIPLAELPKSKMGMGEWLQRRWSDKEARLTTFYDEQDPHERSFKSPDDDGKEEEATYEMKPEQLVRRILLSLFWAGWTFVWLWMLLRLPYQFIYCACVIAFYIIGSNLPGGLAQLLMMYM